MMRTISRLVHWLQARAAGSETTVAAIAAGALRDGSGACSNVEAPVERISYTRGVSSSREEALQGIPEALHGVVEEAYSQGSLVEISVRQEYDSGDAEPLRLYRILVDGRRAAFILVGAEEPPSWGDWNPDERTVTLDSGDFVVDENGAVVRDMRPLEER
jgi:hypothetical protein